MGLVRRSGNSSGTRLCVRESVCDACAVLCCCVSVNEKASRRISSKLLPISQLNGVSHSVPGRTSLYALNEKELYRIVRSLFYGWSPVVSTGSFISPTAEYQKS